MSESVDSADNSVTVEEHTERTQHEGCPNCGNNDPGICTRGPGEHFTTCCGVRVGHWRPAGGGL